jgi:hypothetical protein
MFRASAAHSGKVGMKNAERVVLFLARMDDGKRLFVIVVKRDDLNRRLGYNKSMVVLH